MAFVSAQDEARQVRAFLGDQPGYFVEVGANDPRVISQTWHLEQIGWSGILVEPLPELAETLRRERRAKVYAVACTSPERAGRDVDLHVAGPLSALDRASMASGARPERVLAVPARTLDEILVEAGAPQPLDFVSIDVEGHELEVLRGFELARWRPRLVLLEDHVADLARHRRLRAAGYRLVRRTGDNGWYVPAGSTAAPSWRDRWEILRKYYLALPLRRLRNASRRLRRKTGRA